MIERHIEALIQFGLDNALIEDEDAVVVRNTLYDLLKVIPSGNELHTEASPETASAILAGLMNYCVEKCLIPEDTVTQRDLMEARIMGILTPRQSETVRAFKKHHSAAPVMATNWFYKLCRANNYIQVDRINKNLYWKAPTEFGEMEITVNLSKPEKDPRDIAAAKNVAQTDYPKCLLCVENAGFAGDISRPARQNLRLIPLELSGERWYFQYSPYVYYNEHCIVLNQQHIPMKLNKDTFVKLFEFVDYLPHYFIGSNADLPIVGGSILTHDHFQGGRHIFPMEKAGVFARYEHNEFADIKIGLVKWPMSVIRIAGSDKERLTGLAAFILDAWREYTKPEADVYAYTGDIPHNTITPIARKNVFGEYELDLVLRNNRTTDEHPYGIFHPHTNLHHIKKENIGLIEVMGLAVLPGRLAAEIEVLKAYLTGESKDENTAPEAHREWLSRMLSAYGNDNSGERADEILRCEIGEIFQRVLSDAGVFKNDDSGRAMFGGFLEACGFKALSE